MYFLLHFSGTDKHENTSYSAMQSIFTYFIEKLEQRNPSTKRVSMGEPQNAHYHRPTSSEAQHLMSRSRGEGEESVEQPKVTNQIPEKAKEGGDSKSFKENTSDVKSDTDKQTDKDSAKSEL